MCRMEWPSCSDLHVAGNRAKVIHMAPNWRDRFAARFPAESHLLSGEADNFDFSVRAINLVGGARIELQKAGVTAIVGANNAGKSTILREVYEKLGHQLGFPEVDGLSVASLDVERVGGPADVVAWLGENAPFVETEHSTGFQRPDGAIVSHTGSVQTWQPPYYELGLLAPFLIFYGNAQGRFAIGGSAEMRESSGDPPVHPIHHLQDSRELLDEISAISHQMFGRKLSLDVLGRMLRLRVGEVDHEPPRIDDISREYRDAMAALRPLDDQGDGMRSVMGQILPVATGVHRLVILDEPEAFLHPPQAHALGMQLGRISAKNDVQILVATHDRSFLTGLLASGVDTSVVRLSRNDGAPSASRLNAEELQSLWSDPVLKYTNVLDGLFHRLVVVAEAEGDCAFLAAALDYEDRAEGPVPRNEILFVPTGGKSGMRKVCAALTAVNVPVIAAPDLDILAEMTAVRSLVESVGGSWSDELEQLWKVATAGIRSAREPAKVGHVLDSITAALGPNRDDLYSSSYRETVQAHLRTNGSTWGPVKEYGVLAFKGDARKALDALLRALDDVGVVLVQQGELERLAPEVAVRKGPGWLQAALSEGAQCNEHTQAHVDRILASGALKLAL